MKILLTLLTFAVCAAPVSAQTWPSKPITFVVGSPPGGGTDFVARILSDHLSKALKQPIVILNRPGASGNIGTESVMRAPADGYTWLIQYSGYHVGNPALFPDLRWSPTKDFTGVAMLMRGPHVIAVNAALPVRTLKELIDYGRKGKGLFYASAGQGAIQHIAGEMFGQATQVPVTHVPYKGAGPAVIDLIGGQVDMFITTPPSVLGYAKAGKLKLLAVTANKRHPALPTVPTSAQAGLAGYEVESWFAMFAASAMPKEIVAAMSAAVRKVVESEGYRNQIEEQGGYAAYMDPAAIDGFVQKELSAWAKIIHGANIKAE
ncbi:MAG: tripartite tricarboxylate transporter substrate binding protein [Betaproteobacteria bacterium]|nr:tripartite tricarboxylate transporter substrate binding protein [Betaproteobacteria bacterium]